MMDIIEKQKRLEKCALKRGYNTIYTQDIKLGYVNHTQKTITLNNCIDETLLATYAHELGHIYTRRLLLLIEVIAWVVGSILCHIKFIRIRNYWKIARTCLMSYIYK